MDTFLPRRGNEKSADATVSFLQRPSLLKRLTVQQSGVQPLGRPSTKPRISQTDLVSIIVVLICAVVSIATVYVNALAVRLGPTAQLVLVGLMLSLMSFCTQRQTRMLFAILEARFGRSSLQNYDAILSDSIFVSHVNTWLRICLVIQLALPLTLSAAYKQFVGGTTTIPMPNETGANYALAGPLGLDRIGAMNTGVGLFYNATTPIARDLLNQPENAVRNATFGFNIARLSENRTALLDGPLPSYLEAHQRSLRPGESRELSARVNAIVGSLNTSAPDQSFLDTNTEVNVYSGSSLGLHTNEWDKSALWISVIPMNSSGVPEYNGTRVVGLNLRRGQCAGKWSVTRSTAALVAAWDCIDISRSALDWKLINESHFGLNIFYPLALGEFLNRDNVLNPIEGAHGRMAPNVTSLFVSAGATMVWSRALATVGMQYNFEGSRSSVNPTELQKWGDLRYVTTDEVYANVPTLRRSWMLVLVLCVQPILFLVALVCRVAFFATPVGEGFGLVAMLAGATSQSTDLLKGAAFSGELNRPVHVAIRVGDDASVSYVFNTNAQESNGRLRRKVNYN